MTNEEYIRRAVELAEGWEIDIGQVLTTEYNIWMTLDDDEPPQLMLDALAAQLVRQIDASATGDDRPVFSSDFNGCVLIVSDDADFHAGDCRAGPSENDRTMNTIRAIVDSGVLSE